MFWLFIIFFHSTIRKVIILPYFITTHLDYYTYIHYTIKFTVTTIIAIQVTDRTNFCSQLNQPMKSTWQTELSNRGYQCDRLDISVSMWFFKFRSTYSNLLWENSLFCVSYIIFTVVLNRFLIFYLDYEPLLLIDVCVCDVMYTIQQRQCTMYLIQ